MLVSVGAVVGDRVAVCVSVLVGVSVRVGVSRAVGDRVAVGESVIVVGNVVVSITSVGGGSLGVDTGPVVSDTGSARVEQPVTPMPSAAAHAARNDRRE